ncbi:TPA: hypothetical protein ACT2FU_001230 [Streptococcus suis]
MIDRSYLPFESARTFQDRKMAKWMGFFLSEHTSALVDDLNKVTYLTNLSLEKKLLLLGQVYTNRLTTRISLIDKGVTRTYVGTIPTISQNHIILKTQEGHINLSLDNIISIEHIEEECDESA